jgi:hypothetical protein
MLPFTERQGVLKAQNMPVLAFPVTSDYFYNYWSDYTRTTPSNVEQYKIDGINFGYMNMFYSKDKGSNSVSRYTLLPHITGKRGIYVALFDQGTMDIKGNYTPLKKYYSEEQEFKPFGNQTGMEHTMVGEYYPNKIINDLEAMKAIDDFQQENGGFVAGNEYSMLDILNLYGRPGYVTGFDSAEEETRAGGICFTVTNMSKFQTLMGAQVVERWEHPSNMWYPSTPEAGWLLRSDNTDATVDEKHDYKWIAPKTGYINLTASVTPNGKKVISGLGEALDGGLRSFDATLIATYKWSDTNPGKQAPDLDKLQTAYKNYRAGIQTPPLNGNNLFVKAVPWVENDQNSLFLKSIAPEERMESFTEELKNDPFLSNLVTLKGLIDSYNPAGGDRVGTYLTKTQWYKDQITRFGSDQAKINTFQGALRQLDYSSNLVGNQPVQCVGFAILLNGLSYPSYNFRNISGATKPDGTTPATCAADLVPECIRDGSMISIWQDGFSIKTITNLEDINAGDLFALYNTSSGHVGGVVGKKKIDGNTVLLFAAANQTNNGRIKIFEVDGNNFDVAIGPQPYKKVVIR